MQSSFALFIRVSFVLGLLLPFTSGFSQPVSQVFEDWVTTEGTQHFFIRTDVETDGDNNVYIAGATLNSSGNYDLLVSKYTSGGELLWSDQYDGTGNGFDAATAIALDGSGNAYVTGSTFSGSTDTLDVVTIGYDEDGDRLWLDVWDGPGELTDAGTCIVFGGGAVYVGGVATDGTTGMDYLGLKYNTSGTLLWDETYDHNDLYDVCTQIALGDADVVLGGATNSSGIDWDMLTVQLDASDGDYIDNGIAAGGTIGFTHVRAMERDLDGNIYLTGTVSNGSSGFDIHTVKILDDMTVDWEEDFSSDGNQDDEGNALAIDGNGNVYVGGFKDSTGQGTDFVTLMYDGSGTLQWSAFWNDSADGGDTVKAIAVDSSGRVTVTGTAWNGYSLDYHTIQYDNAGDLVWEVSYGDKRGYDDHPNDIAIDMEGAVVVAGQTYDPVEEVYSYATVRYVVREFVAPVDSDSVSTSLRWVMNKDQLLGTDEELVERVRFYSNQCYPNMYFMDDTLGYVFLQGVDTTDEDTLHRVSMTFNGSTDDQKLLPLEKERYWNNYYLGHVPEGRPFVSLYERLFMQDVWPNIDVMYSSNQRGLKYYIVVNPGGEAGAVSLQYHGSEDLYVNGNDALVGD